MTCSLTKASCACVWWQGPWRGDKRRPDKCNIRARLAISNDRLEVLSSWGGQAKPPRLRAGVPWRRGCRCHILAWGRLSGFARDVCPHTLEPTGRDWKEMGTGHFQPAKKEFFLPCIQHARKSVPSLPTPRTYPGSRAGGGCGGVSAVSKMGKGQRRGWEPPGLPPRLILCIYIRGAGGGHQAQRKGESRQEETLSLLEKGPLPPGSPSCRKTGHFPGGPINEQGPGQQVDCVGEKE